MKKTILIMISFLLVLISFSYASILDYTTGTPTQSQMPTYAGYDINSVNDYNNATVWFTSATGNGYLRITFNESYDINNIFMYNFGDSSGNSYPYNVQYFVGTTSVYNYSSGGTENHYININFSSINANYIQASYTFLTGNRYAQLGEFGANSGISIFPLSTSLLHPTNGTTTNNWDGFINISLFDVNGSVTCNINNSDWDFFSNDNITYIFNNSNVVAPYNYSIAWNCTDTGGASSNGSFWINVQNRLKINIYDEQLNTLILDPITFIFRSGSYEFKDVAINGTYILVNETGLPPNTYQVTLNGTDYYQRIYYLTVSDTQIQEEDFYLLKTNSSSLVTFYFKTLTGESISNLSVVFTTWINLTSSSAPITHRYSDFAGSMLVNLHYLSRYGITITDPNGIYSTKYTEIEPVFASYTIYMNQNTSQNFTSVWDYISYQIITTNNTLNPTATNFTFITSSDIGDLAYFGISSIINGTSYITNLTGYPSGGTASLELPLNYSNNENIDINYFIGTISHNSLNIPLTYSILNISQWSGNNSLFNTAPTLKNEFSERIRILTAILFSIIGMVIFAGFGKRSLAPFVGIPILIVFAIPPIGWIPIWIVAFISIINLGFYISFGEW